MKEHVFDIMFREPYVYQERGLPDQEVKKKIWHHSFTSKLVQHCPNNIFFFDNS